MSPPTTFAKLIGIFLNLIKTALPVLAGLALFAFIWGLVKFIYRVGEDEKAVNDGRNLMTWGLIALFVLISIWGILSFIYSDIGFSRPFGLPLLPTK